MPAVSPLECCIHFGRNHRDVLIRHVVAAIPKKLPDTSPEKRMADGMVLLLLA